MPQSIPKGLTRECVLQALADLDAGIEHPFGPPTGYELVHEGRRYPPKTVIGLACRSLLGRILRPEEFSGGEAPGQANFVLRELGFMVVRKDASPGPEESEEALEPGLTSTWRSHTHRFLSSNAIATYRNRTSNLLVVVRIRHRFICR
jgi:hypothetical protein